jgi:hypothetical protein
MQRKKITAIRSETRESIVIRHRSIPSSPIQCSHCGSEGILLSLGEAGTSLGMSIRQLLELIETGRVHVQETADGHLVICSASLGAL